MPVHEVISVPSLRLVGPGKPALVFISKLYRCRVPELWA